MITPGGFEARGEVGAKPLDWLDLYGFGTANRLGWAAGVGARATW